MNEDKESPELYQSKIVRPNCEEDVFLPAKAEGGSCFPCPKCSYLIPSVPASATAPKKTFQKAAAFVLNEILGRVGVFFVIFGALLLVIYSCQSRVRGGFPAWGTDKPAEVINPFDASLPRSEHPHPWAPEQFDLSKESFRVHVPANYDGSQPFGVLVFLNAGDEMSLPAEWAPVMEEKRLIFVAPQRIGNDQDIDRRTGLSLIAILKAMETYRIDPKRVYTSGMSGGARVSTRLTFCHPELIRGNIPICGVEFYEPVARIEATNSDLGYGTWLRNLAPSLVAMAKQSVRFALITGETDFRRGNVRDIYNYGYIKEGFGARLFDVPGKGHELCSADVLKSAIDFVDGVE